MRKILFFSFYFILTVSTLAKPELFSDFSHRMVAILNDPKITSVTADTILHLEDKSTVRKPTVDVLTDEGNKNNPGLTKQEQEKLDNSTVKHPKVDFKTDEGNENNSGLTKQEQEKLDNSTVKHPKVDFKTDEGNENNSGLTKQEQEKLDNSTLKQSGNSIIRKEEKK